MQANSAAPAVMNTRMETPSRGSRRGRSCTQASARVMRSPRTARLTTTVSTPASTAWARKVIAPPMRLAPRRLPVAPRTSLGEAVSGSRADRSLAKSSVRKNEISWLIVTTTADSPSMILGLARTHWIAPSRISPTASGRSGMTPGLGAGGGA